MKWLFMGLCVVLMIAYTDLKDRNKETIERLQIKADSALNEAEIHKNKILLLQDSIKIHNDSIISLNEDLFVYKYKIERIREYNAIVGKNASQLPFLRGWINRVIND